MTQLMLHWQPGEVSAPERAVVVDPPVGPIEIRVYGAAVASCYLTPERCVELAADLLAAARRRLSAMRNGS